MVAWALGDFRVPTMARCHSGRAASVGPVFSYRGGVFFDGQHKLSGAIHGGDVGLRQRFRISLWQQDHNAYFRRWVGRGQYGSLASFLANGRPRRLGECPAYALYLYPPHYPYYLPLTLGPHLFFRAIGTPPFPARRFRGSGYKTCCLGSGTLFITGAGICIGNVIRQADLGSKG